MDTKRKHSSHHSRYGDSESDISLIGAIRCCTCSLLISLAVAIVIFSLLAVYALTRPDPEGFLLPIASFLCYPCAMLGGFLSCKLYRGSPVLCAVIFALMNLLLSIILYPILPSTNESPISALSFFALRGLLVLCCAVGSVLGVKAFAPNSRKRRRRR